MRKIEPRLALRELGLWSIGGNHERFDRLNTIPIGDDGRRRIHRPHLAPCRAGSDGSAADTSWLAAGGVVSIDKNFRVKSAEWFAEEE